MSFGSALDIKMIPRWALNKLLKVMGHFSDVKFIVKCVNGENPELDALFDEYKNILTRKWIPQALLLGRQNN